MTRDLDPRPISQRYFSREELTAAWLAIRPRGDRRDLDQAMEKQTLACLIRCAAVAARRTREAIASHGSLRPPRDAEISQHVFARRLSRESPRIDIKRLQANDID